MSITNPVCTIMVGPPGSGKSTDAAKQFAVRISQDEQGKEGHWAMFCEALSGGVDIVVDRMNYNKDQRKRYADMAMLMGYIVDIVEIIVPESECIIRCMTRENHPSIKTPQDAQKAVSHYFRFYQKPSADEVNGEIIRHANEPEYRRFAVIVDLDGTLCNLDHRLHHVRKEGKKDWDGFFAGISQDSPNLWCQMLVCSMKLWGDFDIVFCSGRGSEYEAETRAWLDKHITVDYELFMRPARDYRPDYQVKEMLLDYEILPKYDILFAVDDRQQVVDMWRDRGITCLQCAKGDF